MSAKPINLNRFRKDRARADKRARADVNAVKFGRTKAEREADATATERARRQIDNHVLDPGDATGETPSGET